MIKNIAFDFGGVIFDLDYDGAIETFKSIGLADADQRLDRYHQRGFFEDLESGRITPDDFCHQLEPLCHRTLTHDEVLRAWLGYVGAPVDERKLQSLDDLRARGYRTFLLTGFINNDLTYSQEGTLNFEKNNEKSEKVYKILFELPAIVVKTIFFSNCFNFSSCSSQVIMKWKNCIEKEPLFR